MIINHYEYKEVYSLTEVHEWASRGYRVAHVFHWSGDVCYLMERHTFDYNQAAGIVEKTWMVNDTQNPD